MTKQVANFVNEIGRFKPNPRERSVLTAVSHRTLQCDAIVIQKVDLTGARGSGPGRGRSGNYANRCGEQWRPIPDQWSRQYTPQASMPGLSNQLQPAPLLPAIQNSARMPIYYAVQGNENLEWRQGTNDTDNLN